MAPPISRSGQIEFSKKILNNNFKIKNLIDENLSFRRMRDQGSWVVDPGNDPNVQVSDEDARKLGFIDSQTMQQKIYESLDILQQFYDDGRWDVITRAASDR